MKSKDWIKTVIENLTFLGIHLSFYYIKSMSKKKFKNIIKKKIYDKAFQYLIDRKSLHSKVSHIKYNSLQLQDYLKPGNSDISISEMKYIFHLKTRSIDIKQNYKNKYNGNLDCISCLKSSETMRHILECPMLVKNNQLTQTLPDYMQLFGNNLQDKILLSRILKEHMKKRSEFLMNLS